MPNGVAMKLPAGQALLLSLHIYNIDGPLSGHSAIEMVRLMPAQVKTEADMLLSGPATLSLPPASRTTISHTCKVATDQNVFTLFPHMHQLGVHIKTTVTVRGEPVVLHDGDYRFEEQYQVPVGPLSLRAGDAITTECTYQNDTNETVKWGESSDTEMCFSILFRYPKGKSPLCAGANEGGGGGGRRRHSHRDGAVRRPGRSGKQASASAGSARPRADSAWAAAASLCWEISCRENSPTSAR